MRPVACQTNVREWPICHGKEEPSNTDTTEPRLLEGDAMGQRQRRQTLQRAVAFLALTWFGTISAIADDHKALIGNPASILADPATATLIGPRSQQTLLVSARYEGDALRDLTDVSGFESENPQVATVSASGIVTPKANGTTKIIVRVGGKEAAVAITVQDMDKPAPVQFVNHVTAVLSKAGCSMGACHGSPSGKNGFRLSLRGYDPSLDLETLSKEVFGRRTNRLTPDESLILRKPVGRVPHEGGVRLASNSPQYQLLRDWIAEGLQGDPATTPHFQRLQVLPDRRVLTDPANRQRIVALGHFSDGSVRDVTPLAVFTSSNEEVGRVSEDGLVEGRMTGETAILVRYLDQIATSHITFLKPAPNFAWSNPAENNYVDKHSFAKMKMLQILPADVCSDEEFIRRASLDATGALPPIDEVAQFLADKDPAKRAKLIDRLLEKPGFYDFWTLKLADVLRSNRKAIQEKGIHVFQRWIRDSLVSDKPFDQFVRELLVSEGNSYKNPAVNYYRVSRDPQNSVETTAQLFMGVRIQCAKCHNHPFEKWTQNDYYGLAAFFARVKYKPGQEPTEEVVYVDRAGEVTQPRTGQQMPPKFLGGAVAETAAGQDRRIALAQWLTSPDNPFFAKASANRIWFHVMGRGIIDPPDDVRDSNPPANEELLDALTQDFVSHHFSIKHLVRTIMNSRVYQLSAETNESNKDDVAYFSHAQVKMLTAEQLLDAICASTDLPEKFTGLPAGTKATQLPDPEVKHPFLMTFGQPNRELACECERESDSSLSQALQMINGPLVAGKLRDPNNRIGKMLAANRSDLDIAIELYLATLSRAPREPEIKAITDHIKAASDRRKALEDVHWALLNSKEFLFRH
jgi:hypothetical protein